MLVQVPRPERYAVHKLIVADRRTTGVDRLKSIKDREQAAFLIEALAQDRPDELKEAFAEARAAAEAHVTTAREQIKKEAEIAKVRVESESSKLAGEIIRAILRTGSAAKQPVLGGQR